MEPSRKRNTQELLPRQRAARIHVALGDNCLEANAGLLLPVMRAKRADPDEPVDKCVGQGDVLGRASGVDKVQALAGDDCIDNADVLRTREAAGTTVSEVKAPSTFRTFLRRFR
ncbi:MAG: hypothetical protein OXE17_06755 [Chloroflexi bacterium]|nr:hypothetical protein [Chloroflexota bacterium]